MTDALAEAAGVPAALVRPDSDGTAKREAYRTFIASSLRPVLDQIELLASELLEVDVTISAERLAGAGRGVARSGVPGADRQGRDTARGGCSPDRWNLSNGCR